MQNQNQQLLKQFQQEFQRFLTLKQALSEIKHRKIVQKIHKKHFKQQTIEIQLAQEKNDLCPSETNIALLKQQSKDLSYSPYKLSLQLMCQGYPVLENETMKTLTENYFQLPQIEQFSLNFLYTTVQKNVEQELFRGLKFFNNLKNYKLLSRDSTINITEIIRQMDPKYMPNLTHLWLDFDSQTINHNHLDLIFKKISYFTNLKSLILSIEEYFTEEQAKNLVKTLQILSKLEQFKMGNCQFEDIKVFKKFFQELGKVGQLQKFTHDIYYHVDDEKALILNQYISKAKNISHLSLNVRICFGNDNILQKFNKIFENSEKWDHIKHLEIQIPFGNYSKSDFKEFICIISQFKQLKSLNLQTQRFIHDNLELQWVGEKLKQLGNLEKISVSLSKLEIALYRDGLEKFIEIMKNVKSIKKMNFRLFMFQDDNIQKVEEYLVKKYSHSGLQIEFLQ